MLVVPRPLLYRAIVAEDLIEQLSGGKLPGIYNGSAQGERDDLLIFPILV